MPNKSTNGSTPNFNLETLDLQKLVESKDWSYSTKVTALSKLRTLEMFKFNPEVTYKKLSEQGYSDYTIKTYMIVGAHVNPAYKEFLENRSRKFKSVYKTKTDRVDDDFYKKFMESLKDEPEYFNAGFLMGRCGLRLAETLAAKWSDFANPSILHVVGKGNKQREVPCLRKLLMKHDSPLIAGDMIFRPAKLNEFRRRLRPFTPHSLRAYFITRAIERSGLTLHEVQSIVGHESLLSTQRYFRTEVRDAFNKLFGDEK